uniref:cysteine desulfurase n=1 Tax=uncultured Bacteroidota bacterium TaxID=152509 RepID=H5SGI8_9BACT|nr:NifS protein [uncultured Bacteroidetes bacterium]
MSRPVYLDFNATTPLLPDALEAMLPYLREHFGNAASPHLYGKEAETAVENARKTLADLLGISPQELIFTSGATEALNLALQGLARAYASTPKKHLLISATEHKAVLDPAAYLASQGWEVEIVPVTSAGLVEPSTLEKLLRPTTLAVAIMLANNETGVLQPIPDLAKIAHERGAFFLCDTTQAVGKLPVSFGQLGIDLAVLSAHKFYGPKGIGALYVRRRAPRVLLHPLIFGGGHERGLRSGTLPVPLIVGMAAALSYSLNHLEEASARISTLSALLWKGIQKLYPSARLNGAEAQRLPNTLSVTFPGIKARDILARAPLLAAATGSACTSAQPQPSHVLQAMGLSPADATSTLRFSLGIPTTEEDIQLALSYLKKALEALQPSQPPKT